MILLYRGMFCFLHTDHMHGSTKAGVVSDLLSVLVIVIICHPNWAERGY